MAKVLKTYCDCSLLAMHVGKAAVLHLAAARYQDQKGGRLFFIYMIIMRMI